MNEYSSRINRVIDYIETNLSENLSLDELACIANFSKFHFNRIFHSLTGESLFTFIQRLRLEKAAGLLASRPDMNVTEIALECGFSGSASFSKSFRSFFGTSPSQWRKEKSMYIERSENSNLGKQSRKLSKETEQTFPYIEYQNGMQVYRMQTEHGEQIVEVKTFPPMSLAYIRYTGHYQGDGALFQRLWEDLLRWAGPRDLVQPETRFLALYHDDPELTDDNLLRVSIGISVEKDTEVSGNVGLMYLEGGKYACAQFRLGEKDYANAWRWVYSVWFPASGFLPDDRPAFELFPREGEKTTDGKHRVDICVPVLPAR
jgi:AraC family transcriptional regulator